MNSSVDSDLLKQLSPLDGLNPEHLLELANKSQLSKVAEGKMVFKRGDNDKQHVYVLRGEIELIDENNQPVQRIIGGSESSKHPVGHSQPRTHSGRVLQDSIVLYVDSNLIDIMLTWHQTGTYHVEELENSEDGQEDWMSQILQCKAFHKIPPTNIQALFMCMETVDMKPGDKVIKQGEDGDYFYVIKNGRALVTRATASNPKGVKLAELSSGDSFGEEALISDSKRNATITMLSRGTLVRLSKENFISLLNEPILNWVSYEEGLKLIEEESAQWLDVRLPSEYGNAHLKDSTNIPLIFLRMKHKGLDPSRKYILSCDTGRRSSAAAYIMAERGFETYILKDGINSAPENARISGAE